MAIIIKNHQKKISVNIRRVRRSLIKILRILDHLDKDINLLLVDDQNITKLNRQYFGKNCPTNVISFPMTEGEFSYLNSHILGDVVISVETAFRDSLEAEIDFYEGLDFLIIHAVLHLIGYNHENVCDKKIFEMKIKEQEIFHHLHGYFIE